MSTAKNHAKRSHRSNYRMRMYTGSRMAKIKPTVGKTGFMNWIRMIRDAMRRNKETKNDV